MKPGWRRALALGLPALLIVFLAAEFLTWPDVAALAGTNPRRTAFIERYRHQTGREPEWRWVPYADISPTLARAVLVSEDIGFFWHDGFERAEMRKALEDAWDEKTFPRGASTITQQTAKNLWLSPSRNPLRKIKEAMLTRQLERHLTKRRILEIYLNVAEFGPGIYGAEAAARHYFGVSAAALNDEEAAELASGLSRPSAWHPGARDGGYRRQVRRVLERMSRATILNRYI